MANDPLQDADRLVQHVKDAVLPNVMTSGDSASALSVVMGIAGHDGKPPTDNALAVPSEGKLLVKQRPTGFSGAALAQVGDEGRQASNWAVLHTTQGRASACRPIALGVLARLADHGYELDLMPTSRGHYMPWGIVECGQEDMAPNMDPIAACTSVMAAWCKRLLDNGHAYVGINVMPWKDEEQAKVGWKLIYVTRARAKLIDDM